MALYHYGARWLDSAIGRFAQADTIVPEVQNPPHGDFLRSQALNRYSYVLNNPLRYTDPTGMFSEDEIMRYYGVKTWEEALALFGKGGALAGRWGWLQVLREAELGDSVSVLMGWDNLSGGRCGYAPACATFVGTLVDRDGKLFLCDGNGKTVSANEVGHWGDHYLVDSNRVRTLRQDWDSYGNRPLSATRKYYHVRWTGNGVDWQDVGVDTFGLVGEAVKGWVPYGTVVWVASEFAELTTVGKPWDKLELGHPADVLVKTGVPIAQAAKLVPQWGGVMNVISLVVNMGQGVAVTP